MKITLLTGRTFDWSKELGIDIRVTKSAVSKRLTLRIDEKERIPVLTIPRYCSQRKALQFVNEHLDWINATLSKIPQARPFEDGEIINLFGQSIKICHRQSHRGTLISDNCLLIGGNIEFLHRRVSDFIKKTAATELYRLSYTQAQKINQTINHICIKDTKSRWGSCSSKHNINYNWRISLAPQFVINYLVCHEVSHLAHQDHSPEFWNCVAFLCPDYQEGRNWLKTHGKELYCWI